MPYNENYMGANSTALVFLTTLLFLTTPVFPKARSYTWLAMYDSSQTILNRIPAPAGCQRINTIPASFADWLRHLPLKQVIPRSSLQW